MLNEGKKAILELIAHLNAMHRRRRQKSKKKENEYSTVTRFATNLFDFALGRD